MELEQRLGLYQVFLKLYEHNRSLLDDILKLENTSYKFPRINTPWYVQGVVHGEQVYLLTNLIGGKTQMLFQPQQVWTIGRARRVAISIPDRRLSRRHALIRYVDNEGFSLIDLNSTNGSFVNGEPVYQRCLLKDGNLIRLSSLAFSFFICNTAQVLDAVSPAFLAELDALSAGSPLLQPEAPESPALPMNWEQPIADSEKDTSLPFGGQTTVDEPLEPSLPQLSPAQQSEILDRFFRRPISDAHLQNPA